MLWQILQVEKQGAWEVQPTYRFLDAHWLEVQTLANDFMRLEVLEKGGFLACVEARSSFLDKIKGKQFTDKKLS